MLAIPIPFIIAFLLFLLAIVLYLRFDEQAKASFLFLAVCATTTMVVGLRWMFHWPIMQVIQPILASLIPVVAWYCFSQVNTGRLHYQHAIGPGLVVLAVISQPFWTPPLDELITAIYVIYGIGLLRYSSAERLFVYVSLTHWEGVKLAEKIAGWMLLFSALIDTSMSLDFAFNDGQSALYILNIGHLILLPILSIAVVTVSVNTFEHDASLAQVNDSEDPAPNSIISQTMLESRAREIVTQLDHLMRDKMVYLDPDLTLAKLSRKMLIPVKQISIAVNLIYKKNISKLINEYRIEHAKIALSTTDSTITQVLMNSGFQTKSNFNREFTRVTGITPSEFRKQSTHPKCD
jgi:AraC-like DNA-binding protein